MPEAPDVPAHYVRTEAGQLVASLTRQLRDFDLAEEGGAQRRPTASGSCPA